MVAEMDTEVVPVAALNVPPLPTNTPFTLRSVKETSAERG
jgi:hypothetical protein